MYTQRIIHHTALGKSAELRVAMEARTAAANAQGAPHSLSSRIMSLEPAFIHSIRFENLAAIEAYQEKNAGDPNFAAQTAKITACLSRPQGSELYETLIPAQPDGMPKFGLRIKRYIVQGKGPELHRLLEEVVSQKIPGRIGAALSSQVAPPDGANYVTTSVFASLAELDEFRAAVASGAVRTLLNQINDLLDRPAEQEMARILQPFPR